MKKKHLRALNSIEKWLMQQPGLNQGLKSSFSAIKNALDSLPEKEIFNEGDMLPPPAEISNTPDVLAIYSDGGCRGNPGPGACAYVIQSHDGSVVAEGVEFEPFTTNNKMELNGPLLALTELKNILSQSGRESNLTKVKVITDSKYVVEGMKSWVQGWKARGWKKADNKAPENIELWQELDRVRNQYLLIEWMWVKGHGGHPQNEYCDKKANEVMDENIS